MIRKTKGRKSREARDPSARKAPREKTVYCNSAPSNLKSFPKKNKEILQLLSPTCLDTRISTFSIQSTVRTNQLYQSGGPHYTVLPLPFPHAHSLPSHILHNLLTSMNHILHAELYPNSSEKRKTNSKLKAPNSTGLSRASLRGSYNPSPIERGEKGPRKSPKSRTDRISPLKNREKLQLRIKSKTPPRSK